MTQNNNYSINDFEISRLLGKGIFGNVHLAKSKRDGLLVAIKMYEKRKVIEKKMEKELFFELYHQSQAIHPHVTRMYTFFHSEDMLYSVLQWCQYGSLFNLMNNYKFRRLPEMLAIRYIYQIANGLKYCHILGFLHGDLKPENVLLHSDGVAKISDFGLSWPLDGSAFLHRGSYRGTLEYMAPELLNKKSYSEKIDHWSLGVMSFEFLVGKTAFYSKRKQLLIQRILDLNLRFPEIVTEEARNLISNLLRLEPEERLTLHGVMTHNWISH
ncbi:uncharacterized protein [Halyomorpha halys]|uniref:uncharacterized protein n=1 Tax=Halyomorpha halys TaxID=286706 RepID=UPI0006D4CFF1|nr:spindle assembly checkpoint kinase-like [Halyomorpha halys]